MADYFNFAPASSATPLPTIDEKSPIHKTVNGTPVLPTSEPNDIPISPSADKKTPDRLRRRDTADSVASHRKGSVIDQPIHEEAESAKEHVRASPNLETPSKISSHIADTQTLPNLSRTRSEGTEQTPQQRPLINGSGDKPTSHRRRSVHFRQSPLENETPNVSRSRTSSVGEEVCLDEVVDSAGDGDTLGRDRKQSLFTKLKALATSPSFPSHSRSLSGATFPGLSGESRTHPSDLHDASTPDPQEFRFPAPNADDEWSEADADAEESAGEQRTRKKKTKMKKPWKQEASANDGSSYTTPTTPRTVPVGTFSSRNTPTRLEPRRPLIFPRRANSDFSHRDGVSEDEGRERLRRETAWRRRSTAWISSARGLTYGNRTDSQNNQEERRVSNLRRLTGFGGTSEGAEGIATTWRRHKAERGTSLSAQRWRQIKAGLKLIGQRRKTESTVDQVKSAELLAELTSGVPAALILASMFQRDEHGSRRIPILLEQLKVQITDSRIDSHSGDRHLVFRIELEYGSGMTRMKWIIHRTLRDFANLHLKYKLQLSTKKYIHPRTPDASQGLPRFPRSAFPYLRGVRGLDSDREDEEDEAGDETGVESNVQERVRRMKKRRPSFALVGRRSSLGNAQDGETTAGEGAPSKKESYPERQRKKLEGYLQKMIRFLIFRPDSNRLCKFLELSALGVRLAAEGSYHGKEGFLIIQSSKGLDFRKAFRPSLVKRRHSPKWFLVRHSYVVCVDSPEEMNIYDVFLVDPYFMIQTQKVRLRDRKPKQLAQSAKDSAAHPQHHTLRLENSERKIRLLARNERQLHQFEDSIRFMVENTTWSRQNRFDSFAPVRKQCFAQWLVDGRDHMWVVSRAIDQAKDVIYIHDWWLSPELYMRRPAAISQKWRLDRLLQRKAREGVKVFVIMYRNINSAIPIDSEYSKFSLLDLHPNIFVQRSPNQFRQNTFFWAHHEKICIVDHTLAFVGGVDLCFGRWDTPQHLLTDDKPTGFESSDMPKDADHCQLWPGKDYSNPRVQDFYDLDKPYEEMYDRNIIPRMPWHDISMHVVGQPARDLTRHFVQRWNYILRQRKPTRPTPFLLPPPDFNAADLEALGLDGTCEVQILRSSSMWSTGTPDTTEHSIMNAYVKLIENSDHFVYIENQFFISTCEVDGKKIENLIGDALVERIIRAAKNDQAWRAVILVPLMPGFQNTVDSEGGTSVRLIMQCQYRSICRGDSSIFGRLRAHGIEPEDYIQFFSLRTWGKIGPQKRLVTEQLYIHAKCMIVDDRAAIIGSANINERSMLGSRDSECAAIVRDTDMLSSTMNGEPYLVGRFPHTLRMHLMREHLGIDVDELMENESSATTDRSSAPNDRSRSPERSDPAQPIDPETLKAEKQHEREMIERRHRIQDEFLTRSEDMHSFNHDVDWEQGNNPNLKSNRKLTADSRVTDNPDHRKDVSGEGPDGMATFLENGLGKGRDSALSANKKEVLISDIAPELKGTLARPKKPLTKEDDTEGIQPSESTSVDPTIHSEESLPSRLPPMQKMTSDADTGSSLETEESQRWHPLLADLKRPLVDENCMRDPVNDVFYYDTWQAVAENNTKIYRAVFRCMPDSEVKSWKEYKEYSAYEKRFAETMNQPVSRSTRTGSNEHAVNGVSGHPISSPSLTKSESIRPLNSEEAEDSIVVDEKYFTRSTHGPETGHHNDERAGLRSLEQANSGHGAAEDGHHEGGDAGDGSHPEKVPTSTSSINYIDVINTNATTNSQRRRRRAGTRGSRRELPSEVMDRRRAEEYLKLVQGHLICWPYDWLEKEEQGGNWLYTLDQISPIEIYN